jgi:hypothetical protein
MSFYGLWPSRGRMSVGLLRSSLGSDLVPRGFYLVTQKIAERGKTS